MEEKDKDKEQDSVSSESKISQRKREDGSSRDMISRFFEEDSWLDSFDILRPARMLSPFGRRLFPRVDVSETDTEVKIVADIPGIDPDNIDIEVEGRRMSIGGYMERERGRDEERPYRYERAYGEFRREFLLPTRVKEDQIRAVCKNGVLTITLTKIEGEKRNKIKIEKE